MSYWLGLATLPALWLLYQIANWIYQGFKYGLHLPAQWRRDDGLLVQLPALPIPVAAGGAVVDAGLRDVVARPVPLPGSPQTRGKAT